MVGTDKSTELWRYLLILLLPTFGSELFGRNLNYSPHSNSSLTSPLRSRSKKINLKEARILGKVSPTQKADILKGGELQRSFNFLFIFSSLCKALRFALKSIFAWQQ